jgi:2-(3-amino-3-carboxypropyl)histidine synthase
MRFSIKELEEKYQIDFDKIINKIKKSRPSTVLLQFPEGLKPYAISIVDYLEEKTNVDDFRIYLGSCFGACDIPNIKVDLIVQFGHAPWDKKEFNEIK